MTTEEERKEKQMKWLNDLNEIMYNKECNCICHRESKLVHKFLCCSICEDCGLRIPIGFMENHLKVCKK